MGGQQWDYNQMFAVMQQMWNSKGGGKAAGGGTAQWQTRGAVPQQTWTPKPVQPAKPAQTQGNLPWQKPAWAAPMQKGQAQPSNPTQWKPAGSPAQWGSAAQDRSRTPVARTAAPPKTQPPNKNKNGLPSPWEEHFSEEHGVPFYWNSETGEAVWEKTAV